VLVRLFAENVDIQQRDVGTGRKKKGFVDKGEKNWMKKKEDYLAAENRQRKKKKEKRAVENSGAREEKSGVLQPRAPQRGREMPAIV